MTRDEAVDIVARALIAATDERGAALDGVTAEDYHEDAGDVLNALGWDELQAPDALAIAALETKAREVGYRAAMAEMRPAMSRFYREMTTWTESKDAGNPPQNVLEASYAIQQLTDPEREVPTP